MATLATQFGFLGRGFAGKRLTLNNTKTSASSKSEAAAHVPLAATATANAGVFALRALPNDDIYFFSKQIDNSRLVRQADPKTRGECWSAIAAFSVLAVLGGSIIAPRVGGVMAGYKIEALKQEQARLLNEKSGLDAKRAQLLRPGRLVEFAGKQHLASPGPGQIIHSEQGADGVMALDTNAPSSSALNQSVLNPSGRQTAAANPAR